MIGYSETYWIHVNHYFVGHFFQVPYFFQLFLNGGIHETYANLEITTNIFKECQGNNFLINSNDSHPENEVLSRPFIWGNINLINSGFTLNGKYFKMTFKTIYFTRLKQEESNKIHFHFPDSLHVALYNRKYFVHKVSSREDCH